MKHVTCKDIGIRDCSFIAYGNSQKEIWYKIIRHLREFHPDAIKRMKHTDARKLDLIIGRLMMMH